MTTIVAVEHELGVTFGWDSLTSLGNAQYATQRSKVFVNSTVTFGIAGDVSTASVIEYMTIPPIDDTDMRRWTVRSLIPAMRAALDAQGMLRRANGAAYMPNAVLVAVGGRLLEIGADFSVDGRQCFEVAIGSGGQFASGALHAARGTPAERVRAALRAASAHDGGTGGPLHVALVCRPPEPAPPVRLQRAA